MRAFYENRNEDFYCRDTRYSRKTIGCVSHLHYHIELGFFMGGRVRASIDSNRYEVGAGDIVVVFPNQIHSFEMLERGDYILLIINPDFLPEFARQFTTSLPTTGLLHGAADDAELRGLIEKISDVYFSSEPYREMIIRGYLLAFFGKILSRLELHDVQSRDYRVLGMILNYCTNNSDKNLSLGMLEKELHISKYYISHMRQAGDAVRDEPDGEEHHHRPTARAGMHHQHQARHHAQDARDQRDRGLQHPADL